MTSEALHDAQLLARTAAGDADAFGEFYDRYEAPVLAYMLRRTAMPEAAADLAAEVFASALAGAGQFRYTGAPPAAWLFRIAHNVVIDSYRAMRVQDEVRQRLGMPVLFFTDDMAEHLERVAARAEGAAALAALFDLPADQQAAVVARILEEREYDDIAAELACSESVVRKRVSRGLGALRAELTKGAHRVEGLSS